MKSREKSLKLYKRFMSIKDIHRTIYISTADFSGYKVIDDRGFTIMKISNKDLKLGGFHEFQEKAKKKK